MIPCQSIKGSVVPASRQLLRGQRSQVLRWMAPPVAGVAAFLVVVKGLHIFAGGSTVIGMATMIATKR